jgi:hypothetical protein
MMKWAEMKFYFSCCGHHHTLEKHEFLVTQLNKKPATPPHIYTLLVVMAPAMPSWMACHVRVLK